MLRFALGTLGAVIAVALIGSPAYAAHLVFDVDISSVTDTHIDGNSVTTAFSKHFVQTFSFQGPPAGTSLYTSVNHEFATMDQNSFTTGGVTATATPLEGVAGIAPTSPPYEQVDSFGVYQTAYYAPGRGPQYAYQEGRSLAIISAWGVGDDTHAIGGSSSLYLHVGQEIYSPPFPPAVTPMTIDQIITFLGSQLWNYSFDTSFFDETFDSDGGNLTGVLDDRQYSGMATLDLSRSSTTPEPATWGLMILGFGATGAALRRKMRPA